MSPHGNKTPIKPLSTLMEEQHRREERPLLTRGESEEDLSEGEGRIQADPLSVGSDEFQEFVSYESQETKSATNKTLTTSGMCISGG